MLHKSLCAGIALLAAANVASAASSASCSYSAVASASSKSEEAFVGIVAKLDDVLCGDSVEPVGAMVSATASAFAKAMVEVDATCSATGTASFRVNGMTAANAQATALAGAYAKAFASSKCLKCSAESASLAETVEKIYLNATIDLTVTLAGAVNGGSETQAVSVIVEAIEEATLKPMAKVVVAAKAAAGECAAATKAVAKAGDNSVTCAMVTGATSDFAVIDAIAKAAGAAATVTCNEETGVDLQVTSEAVAEAYALAVTKALGGCKFAGKGYGCVAGSADITVVAKAFAKSFAAAYGIAISKCAKKCKVDDGKLAKKFEKVIAKAYSSIRAKVCARDVAFFKVKGFDSQLVIASAPAIADVIVETSVDIHGRCTVFVSADATVNPTEVEVVDGATEIPEIKGFTPVRTGGRKARGRSGKKAPSRAGRKPAGRAGKKAPRRAGKKAPRRAGKKTTGRSGKKTTGRGGKKASRRGGKKAGRGTRKGVQGTRVKGGEVKVGRRSVRAVGFKAVSKRTLRRKD